MQKRCKRRDLRPCSHARARSLRVYKNCAQRQRPTSLPEISTIAEVASRSARSWLPLMTLSLEFNFHRIADVQDKIAGIFHSPFHVRNREVRGSRPTIAFETDLHRDRQFVFIAVKAELSMDLNGGRTGLRDLAFHAIRAEADVGILCALEHVPVHFAIAAVVTGFA